MSEKVKLNGRQWLAVIVCGMAYVALGNLQYLARDYYVIYKETNGLTDGQMGMIMTAVGIAAVIAYFYNGFVTDLVRPKIMMMFSCSVCVILGAILLINPGYVISVAAFCGFALLPMWSPMAKLLAGLGTQQQSNKIFAYLDFFIAASGLLAGFAASAAVARAGAAFGVKIVTIIYIVMNALCVICLPLVDKTTKADFIAQKTEAEEHFSLKNVLILFRDPDQWLGWLAVGLGYTGYIGMTYISPLLADVFGVSPAVITVLDTIKNSGIGLIAPLIAGALATKLGAVRSYFSWLALYIISMVLIIVIPWKPALAIIAIMCIVMLSFSVKGRSAISSTIMTNVATPMALFGTSIGIQSLIMTIPDTFFYTIAGSLIDQYGNTGYYFVFGGCLIFAVVGFACCMILDRRLKAGKTSEWFFAQKNKVN